MPTFLDRIRSLPLEIQDLLASEEISEINDRIFTEHEVPAEQEVAVLHLLQAIYLKDRAAESLGDGLREVLPEWAPDRLRALARDLIGYRLLPMSGYLRGVREELERLGGDPAAYPRHTGTPSGTTVDDVASAAASAAGVTFTDRVREQRFRDAVTTYLRSVRDRLETFDTLTRGVKTGGVELDPESASVILTTLEERRPAGAAQAAAPTTAAQPRDALALAAFEEVELAREHPAAPMSGASDRTRAVHRIIARSGAKFRSEDIARRFRMAIEARLRDIRDHQETLDLLMRPSSVGGLGIPKPQAEKVLGIVEEEFGVLHGRADGARSTDTAIRAPHPARHTSPAPAPTTAITAQLVHPVPPTRTADDRKPEAQSVPLNTERRIPAIPPPPPPPPTAMLVHPVPPALEQQAPTPSPVQRKPLPVIARSRSDEAIPSTAAPGLSRSPTGSLVMTQQRSSVTPAVSSTGRPKVQDIRSVPPRLVGPIEELAALTLEDFRKIAATPADAAARIAQKLELLERDSYTKRAEGLRAFRGSPLMAMYGALVNAAITGKRTVEAELAARGSDRAVMTSDEFHALATLNAQLRQ